jgi:hypothetical protein
VALSVGTWEKRAEGPPPLSQLISTSPSHLRD